jgi:hypothetical protein
MMERRMGWAKALRTFACNSLRFLSLTLMTMFEHPLEFDPALLERDHKEDYMS